jgi:hypothetical protein
VYERLEIERSGIEQVWPRMNIFHRCLKRIRDRREQRQRARLDSELQVQTAAIEEQLTAVEREALDAGRHGTTTLAATPALPPLTRNEVDRRLKALDDMYAAIVPPIIAAHEKARQLIDNRRTLLLDYEDGKTQLFAAIFELGEAYQRVKRDREAIRKEHELYGAYPSVVSNFAEAQRFFDGTREMNEAIGYLQIPITEGQVALLKPWAYAYLKDIAQIEQWAKNCSAQIKLMRIETSERLARD